VSDDFVWNTAEPIRIRKPGAESPYEIKPPVCTCFRPQGGGRWPLSGPCPVHGTGFDMLELPPEFEPVTADVSSPATRLGARYLRLWDWLKDGDGLEYVLVPLFVITMAVGLFAWAAGAL
jgi:hypothetical protein